VGSESWCTFAAGTERLLAPPVAKRGMIMKPSQLDMFWLVLSMW
jgi:hypothetical protein